MKFKTAVFALIAIPSAMPSLAMAETDLTIQFNHVDQRNLTKVCGHGDPHHAVASFKALKDSGNLQLIKFFEKKGKCFEAYQMTFKSMADLTAFAGTQALPDYSFGGIGYAIYAATLNKAIKTGDAGLYEVFLSKKISSSASEELHTLFGTLRKNPGMFLKGFCSRNIHGRDEIMAQQFDYNLSLEAHLMTADGGAGKECLNSWNEYMTEVYPLMMQPAAIK